MRVVDVLTGADFLTGLFLLIATAALTGLLVPGFRARLDERRYRQQKVFESGLARQAKIIDAQAALLEAVAEVCWGFLLRALALTYHAQRRDAAKLEEAWTLYNAEAWSFYARLMVETSKAQWLATAEIKDELTRLNQWFQTFDLEVDQAYGLGRDALVLPVRRQRIDEGFVFVEGALNQLAQELGLGAGAVASSWAAQTPTDAR